MTSPFVVKKAAWQGQAITFFCSDQNTIHPRWVQVADRAW